MPNQNSEYPYRTHEEGTPRPITPFTQLNPLEQAEATEIAAIKISKLVNEGATGSQGLFTVGLASGARAEVPYTFVIGPGAEAATRQVED